MRRVKAGLGVTIMTDLQTFWDWTKDLFVGPTMGPDHFATNLLGPVAPSGSFAPDPAGRKVNHSAPVPAAVGGYSPPGGSSSCARLERCSS